jgi:hypothetical protein
MVQSRKKRRNSVSSLKKLFSVKAKEPLFPFHYPTDELNPLECLVANVPRLIANLITAPIYRRPVFCRVLSVWILPLSRKALGWSGRETDTQIIVTNESPTNGSPVKHVGLLWGCECVCELDFVLFFISIFI